MPPFDKPVPKPRTQFKASLMSRAKKRMILHSYESEKRWLVAGEKRLGDARTAYAVELNPETRRYCCDCYQSDYGQVRAKRVCSHVLAVILHRRSSLDATVERGEEREGVASPFLRSEEGEPAEHASRSNADGYAAQGAPPPPVSPPSHTSHIPDVDDAMWGWPELPAKFQAIQSHQWDAVMGVMERYEQGCEVVMLDAPTGSGKTLIGELVRRLLKERALYVCTSKTLQDQMVGDFAYAKVLKGRTNYPTQSRPWPEVTCGDCTKEPGGEDCDWCPDVHGCAYETAKAAALRAPLAVVNTAYLLAEANHIGNLSGRGLVVADEADELERTLMGFVTLELTAGRLAGLGTTAPKKGSHKSTIASWFVEDLEPAIKAAMRKLPASLFGADIKTVRRRQQLSRLLGEVKRIAVDLGADEDNWVRDNDAGPMVLKPVRVADYAGEQLWRHGKKWLCMSATVISGDEMAGSLGIEEAGLKWDVVNVPMTFPVENRRIHVRADANMVAKEKVSEWPKMAAAIERILGDHRTERVLVHTVSYELARYLRDRLAPQMGGRRVLAYTNASSRDQTVAEFRATPAAVLLAPSLDRGVDLRDDACRVVVIAKIPFPYLGDQQVSARMHGPGGKSWYAVQTVRTIVQMLGRGVRSREDWCHNYILDAQFKDNVYKRHKRLFPEWIRDAITIER